MFLGRGVVGLLEFKGGVERFAREVRNGKIKRQRPAVVRDVEYDVFNY